MINWHGKKKAHETKAMKQLALKNDLVPQKKWKKWAPPLEPKTEEKNGKEKKGAKNDPPPPKKMLFGLVFLASIQSISHFGLVIFMGPDKKYNP